MTKTESEFWEKPDFVQWDWSKGAVRLYSTQEVLSEWKATPKLLEAHSPSGQTKKALKD